MLTSPKDKIKKDLDPNSVFSPSFRKITPIFEQYNDAFFKTVKDLNCLLEIENHIMEIEGLIIPKERNHSERIRIINSLESDLDTLDLLKDKYKDFFGYYLRLDLIRNQYSINNCISTGAQEHPYYTVVIKTAFEPLAEKTKIYKNLPHPMCSNSNSTGESYIQKLNLAINRLKIRARRLIYLTVFPTVCAAFGLMFIFTSASDAITNTGFYSSVMTASFALCYITLSIATLIYSLGTKLNLIYHYAVILIFALMMGILVPETYQYINTNFIIGITLFLFAMNHARHYYQLNLIYKQIGWFRSKVNILANDDQ